MLRFKLNHISKRCPWTLLFGLLSWFVTVPSQIIGVSIVCSIICSGANQRKHQSAVSLVFVGGIHRSTVDSPHKEPVTRKCFHLMTSSWSQVTATYLPMGALIYFIYGCPNFKWDVDARLYMTGYKTKRTVVMWHALLRVSYLQTCSWRRGRRRTASWPVGGPRWLIRVQLGSSIYMNPHFRLPVCDRNSCQFDFRCHFGNLAQYAGHHNAIILVT